MGSNSNAGENGLDKEERRAAILEVDPATGQSRVFASGLRNPNGMAWQPETGVLWTVVNERDELGSDLVPDYLTSVKDGGFYGWPFSYYGQHVDDPGRATATRAGGQSDRSRLRARQPHRFAGVDVLRREHCCRSDTGAGPSSGSTARGIASRAAATRSSSSRSSMARPAGQPMDVLTGFVNAERRGTRPPGRRRDRSRRCAPGRRRCRQHHLACRARAREGGHGEVISRAVPAVQRAALRTLAPQAGAAITTAVSATES